MEDQFIARKNRLAALRQQRAKASTSSKDENSNSTLEEVNSPPVTDIVERDSEKVFQQVQPKASQLTASEDGSKESQKLDNGTSDLRKELKPYFDQARYKTDQVIRQIQLEKLVS